MSVGWMDRVWKHSTESGSRLLVLLAIADNADEATGIAWPSIAYLSRKTRMGERAIQRSIQTLAARGELTIEARPGAANRYRLEVGRGVSSDRGVKLTGVSLETGEGCHPDRGGGVTLDGGGVSLGPPVTKRVEKKEPREKKETARRARLPDDFMLTEERKAYAVEKGCRNPARTFESFLTFYRGNGKAQLDWDATFRTWVLGAHGGPDWKACGCGGAPTDRPRPRVLAAGGVPMLTYEESVARRRAEGRL